MQMKTTVIGHIHVLNRAGKAVVERWRIDSHYPQRFAAIKAAWGVEGFDKKTGAPIVRIPEQFVTYREVYGASNSRPLMCVYNAVEAYMVHFFGRKLDTNDLSYFQNHPLTRADGSREGDTLRIVQELIEPYGLVVSRVRLTPGVSMEGDIKQWPLVLGANPLALMDRKTSNKQFSMQTGMDLAQANELFRFEFSEDPLRPSIGCGLLQEAAHGQAAGSGHASYNGPRAKVSYDKLQIQLDWNYNVTYSRAPKFAELPAKKKEPVEFTLDIFGIKDPKGNAIVTKAITRHAKSSQTDFDKNGDDWWLNTDEDYRNSINAFIGY